MNTLQLMPSYNMTVFDKDIADFFQKLAVTPGLDTLTRLYQISEYFLQKPYETLACGEGPEGRYNQRPLYRTDLFDCVTYLNQVLAMLLADDISAFRDCIIRLNYHDHDCCYLKRHHFMCVGWNQTHQRSGLIKDITASITDPVGERLAQTARTLIDRPNWYRRRTLQDIQLLQPLSVKEKQALLAEIHAFADRVKPQESIMPYLPISKLFDGEKPITQIFSQIPDGAIVEIVRPNWQWRAQVGTNLNVSHVGFVFKKNDRWLFRQASSLQKKVCDVDFADYLYSYIAHPTVKGINVQALTLLDK